MVRFALSLCFLFLFHAPAFADRLDELARDFWAWRAVEQPITSDDVPRIDRSPTWVPDWSERTVARRRRELIEFENRWRSLSMARQPVARQVDYRLIGSAIERVRWELDVTRDWQRDAEFYVQQTLGSIFDALLEPPPFDSERGREIVRRMENIPLVCSEARTNLREPQAPLARLAIAELENVRPELSAVAQNLQPLLSGISKRELDGSTDQAIRALESYRTWLQRRLPRMTSQTTIGRKAYVFFLKEVALVPFTPEELLQLGEREWARSVSLQEFQENRDRGLPELLRPPSQAEQIARQRRDEARIRRFLEAKHILTIPSWVGYYWNLPLPAYLAPLAGLGVTDDLTGPNRLHADAVHYIPAPSPKLGYFDLVTALDPRVMIVHEGIPGHYLQLALSWRNPDMIRRHYYDSGANEGIAFYSEEMMLQSGLFDDSPRTREIIYNFMRLRALRVEVDVRLALGEFTLHQAAHFLQVNVPMDPATALDEASFFVATPGQAISYQVGKTQLLQFLADAQRVLGSKFSLQKFHDFVWLNGNVPIALQRWELLGLKDEIR